MKEMARFSSDTLRGESNNFNRVLSAAIQVWGTKKVREDVHNRKGSFTLQRWQVSFAIFRGKPTMLKLLLLPAHTFCSFCTTLKILSFWKIYILISIASRRSILSLWLT
jgi:hypothetical protein